MERIRSIDGIKGICMIIIAFFYHYMKYWHEVGFTINDYSFYCVEIFFTCSGFTIAYNYRDKEKINFKDYFFKKYIRIMPLYWVTTMVFYLAYMIAETMLHATLNAKIDALKMCLDMLGIYAGWIVNDAPINSPLWTVNILFLLYIIYYVIRKITRKSKELYIGLVVLMTVLGLIGIKQELSLPFMYYYTYRGYAAFGIGLILYELYVGNKEMLQKIGYMFGIIIVIREIYALCAKSIFLYENNAGLFAVIVLCPVVISLSTTGFVVKRILECRLIQMLGRYSLSIYMWHFLIREIIIATRYNDTLTGWIIYVLVTIVVSIISKKIIEPILDKQCKRIGRKYENINRISTT